METATIRIPEEKKNLLKAAASLENRKMNDIVIELIDEYIESRKETLELLAIPGFLRRIRTSQREYREGKGVSLEDVRKHSWTVNLSRAARKALGQDRKQSVQLRIRDRLKQLEELENPLRHKDVRALEGKLVGLYRFRIGEYRVIFELDSRQNRDRRPRCRAPRKSLLIIVRLSLPPLVPDDVAALERPVVAEPADGPDAVGPRTQRFR